MGQKVSYIEEHEWKLYLFMVFEYVSPPITHLFLSHVGLVGVQGKEWVHFQRLGISVAVQEEHSGHSVILTLSAVPLLHYLHLKLHQLILFLRQLSLSLHL